MIKKILSLSVVWLMIICTLQAQQIKENEILVIKGEKFVLHKIRTVEKFYSIIEYIIQSKNETPYFIAKQYNITVEQLYAYNPETKRFRKGKTIRIPVWDENIVLQNNENIQAIPGNSEENELLAHEIKPGETLYSLSKKYGISESEILFYNPGAKKLQAGSKLYIPSKLLPPEESKADIIIEESKPEFAEKPDFFEHIIESGQTLWGTARKYGVTEKEITDLNPVLHAGFQAGMRIKIPVKQENQSLSVKPLNENAFEKHFVEKGETLFGLSAKYNLKISEIKSYNPILEKRNLIYGETILIPKKPDPEIVEFMQNRVEEDSVKLPDNYYEIEIPVEIPESCKPLKGNLFAASKKIDVALFLPLFLEANDTLNKKRELLIDSLALANAEERENLMLLDSLIEENKPEDSFIGFYADTKNYLEFYEGVLIAIDSLQKTGMNIQLQVFDTERNPEKIKRIIYDEKFLETDLIIGPVFEEVQKEVAQIAHKNRIPMVSPLVSNSLIVHGNPYFFQVNPSREYLASQTAEMISEEYLNSNFIVLKTRDYSNTPEEKMVDLIREKIYNSGFLGHSRGTQFIIYDFKNEGAFGLRRILSKNKENVVYIPSSNEGELSLAISNLDNLADKYSITLIGSNRFRSYESIDISNFHDLKLEYISPYWVDYRNPETMQIIEKFKKNFGIEPGNFGMQGFDVSFYFLNALQTYGNDFAECMNYLQPELLQGSYQFEKVSEFGGYMNEGVSVIQFTKDYEVKRTRIKGRYRLSQN